MDSQSQGECDLLVRTLDGRSLREFQRHPDDFSNLLTGHITGCPDCQKALQRLVSKESQKKTENAVLPLGYC